MRLLPILMLCAGAALAAGSAQAETRVFIIANYADGSPAEGQVNCHFLLCRDKRCCSVHGE